MKKVNKSMGGLVPETFEVINGYERYGALYTIPKKELGKWFYEGTNEAWVVKIDKR